MNDILSTGPGSALAATSPRMETEMETTTQIKGAAEANTEMRNGSRHDAAGLTIRLDDQPLTLPIGATLADLLAQQQRRPETVATAVNGRFVARDRRGDTVLRDGDQVLFFQPIVGG